MGEFECVRCHRRSGEGTTQYHNGDIYEGNWIQDRIGLSGKISYADGASFKGRFRDSMRDRPWEGEAEDLRLPCWNADLSGQPPPKWEWDGGHYSGSIRCGVRQGHGRCVYENGDQYVGEWNKDRRHGDGILYEKETKIATKGLWRNDKIVGLRCDDGGQFIGTWKDGQPVEGQYTHPCGCVFNGKFKDGEPWEGTMERHQPGDGSSFTGIFHEGHRSGNGRCEYSDGAVYLGIFKAGERSDDGECTWPNGGKFTGLWQGDRPWGGAMVDCPYFGAGSLYTGSVTAGRQSGKGQCLYATGDRYQGEWRAGERHGKGEYWDVRGGHFQGKFKDNHPWEGTMENFIYDNGDTYHGTWADGMQQQGAFTRADGHGFVGKFLNNLPYEGVYTRPHTAAAEPMNVSM